MRIISDTAEIAGAQARFTALLKAASTQSGNIRTGHQGESLTREGVYLQEFDLWYAWHEHDSRYWNAFGTGNPFGSSSPPIVVEINPPRSGVDSRMGGLFLADEQDQVYLAHRGRINGGTALFLSSYKEQGKVIPIDGSREALVIGSLDSPHFLSDLERFVKDVERFKRDRADGDGDGTGDGRAGDRDISEAWDEFARQAGRLVAWDGFDADERDYKLQVAANVAQAKKALDDNDEDWVRLLKKAFGTPNNLTYFMVHGRFLNWVKDHTSEAAEALRGLWFGNGEAPARLEAFLQCLPKDVLETPGNGANIGSLLLMGVDPYRYPVYKPTPFTKGRNLTRHPSPPGSASSRELYEAALAFLDRIMDECQARGVSLRDRLDAQSVLWAIVSGSGNPTATAHQASSPRSQPGQVGQAWLFQANPKEWNLKSNLKNMQPGDIDDWMVSRFIDQVKDGDPVILWQGGSEAAIYAIGRLLGEVRFRTPSPGNDGAPPERYINYQLERILQEPIAKKDLLADSVLSGLTVLRAPQGTNFRVTAEQWARLQELLEEQTPRKRATTFEDIWKNIACCGLRIAERTLRRFHLAIQTRGFVVLCGASGTGKTWLAEAYAEAIGAEVCLVPVAPNWTANEDLLGYFNPLDGKYHDTTFSRFLREAASEFNQAEKEKREAQPYVLILDEMNLARVEYYFAKFLSAMERRSRNVSDIELEPGSTVRLTPNLLFVGTVNVDETTHLFSDKVFDRAQVLELPVERAEVERHMGDVPYKPALLEIWDAVADVAPFAFRVIDDIRSYIDDAEQLDVPWQHALDEQILQKILPKLSGSEVGPALDRLAALSAEQYPLAHEKTKRMRRDFGQHGFASYF